MIPRRSRSTTRPFPGGALHRSLSWTLALCLLLGAASLQWLSANRFLAGDMAGGAVPDGLTAAAWQHIQEVVHQSGYNLSRQAATEGRPTTHYLAVNQEQSWSLAFDQRGVTVTPREADAGWRWELALSSYGYADRLEPAAAAPILEAEGNRLVYRWDNNLTEWYANEGGGLEQGFAIQRRPGGRRSNGPLQIELALRSSLVPTLGGEAIHFLDAEGEAVLRYDRLYVTDATGRVLPAHLELDSPAGVDAAPAILRIVVDDSAAVYPIAIDPWLQQAKLTASDAAEGDRFGYAVAISGDTVVVGVPFDSDNGAESGSVYVFTRPEAGWTTGTETAKLTASDGSADDRFGYSVAIDGNTIVVGAPYAGAATEETGYVYVFVRPEGGWATGTETARLTASDGADNDKFGNSVAISGHAIIVGAPSDDDNVRGSGSGSAYLFVEPEGGWVTGTETAKLTASDGAANDNLGHAVAIDGDTAVASAPYDDDNGNSSGSAYVFVRPPGGWGTGSETAKLTASDGNTFDGLGESVGVSGDTVVAGAPGTNDDGNNSGSIYVFVRPETGWVTADETAELTASDGREGDNLGRSVAISGDTIVAGAPYDDEGSGESGSAYLFVRPASGWAGGYETQRLNPSDAGGGDEFGGAVSVSGGAAVIGAAWDDDGGEGSGSAYVFVNGFCSKTSGDWASNDAWVGGAPPSSSDDVCISSGNTFVVSGDAHVKRLLISPGATLILPVGASLTVEEMVTNNGAMRQILNVNNASLAFLEIQNGDGSQTHYRGVNIDTTAGAADLGEVTVTVRELNPGEYCTETGPSSPTYAQRCFRIGAGEGPGLVRLWGLRDELNDIAEDALAVYHYAGSSTWEELVTNGSNGNDGGSYVYAEGDTPGFSSFLLGEAGNAPTAITLRGAEARADPLARVVLVLGLAAIAAAGLYFGWRARRPRSRA